MNTVTVKSNRGRRVMSYEPAKYIAECTQGVKRGAREIYNNASSDPQTKDLSGGLKMSKFQRDKPVGS